MNAANAAFSAFILWSSGAVAGASMHPPLSDAECGFIFGPQNVL